MGTQIVQDVHNVPHYFSTAVVGSIADKASVRDQKYRGLMLFSLTFTSPISCAHLSGTHSESSTLGAKRED